ncbi:MAG: hypothetical protein ACRDP5_28300 [Streptosporangiaceae bacterium]
MTRLRRWWRYRRALARLIGDRQYAGYHSAGREAELREQARQQAGYGTGGSS